jgi:hypothetical protein
VIIKALLSIQEKQVRATVVQKRINHAILFYSFLESGIFLQSMPMLLALD